MHFDSECGGGMSITMRIYSDSKIWESTCLQKRNSSASCFAYVSINYKAKCYLPLSWFHFTNHLQKSSLQQLISSNYSISKMKFTLALATFVVAVYGQTVDDIPVCARTCITNAITSATTCSATDYKCACQTANFNAIQAASINCVVAACGATVAISTYSYEMFLDETSKFQVLNTDFFC